MCGRYTLDKEKKELEGYVDMNIYEVGKAVNNARNNSPDLLEKVSLF